MKPVHRQAIKSVSVLWLGTLLGAACAFLIQVVIARALGVSGYGDFTAAFTIVTLLAPIAAFGVSGFWLNVFGKEGWGALRWLTPSFKFTLLTAAGIFSVLWLWAIFGPHSNTIKYLIGILSFHVFGLGIIELVGSKLQLEERYARIALWQTLPHLLRIILVCAIYFLFEDSHASAGLYAGVYLVVALITVLIGARELWGMHKGKFLLKGHARKSTEFLESAGSVGAVFSMGWPFGVATLLHLIYFQRDIVLVKYMAGAEAAGAYSAAFYIMSGIYLFPSVIYQRFMQSKLHIWANSDMPRLRKSYKDGNNIMLAMGIICMGGVWLVSPIFIRMAFGVDFYPAIGLLSILALCLPLRFLSTSVGAILVTKNHASRKVKCMGVVALVNVSLNCLVIPSYGAVGAAYTTVLSELLLLTLYFHSAKKYVLGKKIV